MTAMSSIFAVIFLICCAYVLDGTTAEEDDCLSTTLAEFLKCVGENPCTCSTCGSADFSPSLPTTCGELNELLCPISACCVACSAPMQAYYQCTVVDVFVSVGLVSDVAESEDCLLECSSFPAPEDEIDATCEDEDYPCAAEQAEYTSCYLSCFLSDGCNQTATPQADPADIEDQFLDAVDNEDTCASLNVLACSPGVAFNGCCPECDVHYANIFQCTVDLDLEEKCTVECADGEVAPSAPSDNPDDVPVEPPAEEPSNGEAPSIPATSSAYGSKFVSEVSLASGIALKLLLETAMYMLV
jgi:hypothetical protein